MIALVTGCAGFIGSHLTEALLGRGARVIGIDCFTDYYGRAAKQANLASIRGRAEFSLIEDRIERVDLGALLDGVTHVFHLAAQAGVRNSWGRDFRTYTVDNIDATQTLLEAAKGRPIRRFVYASTSSVYGDAASIPMREDAALHPISPYGVTKLAAEHLCMLYNAAYGVPAVALRYFTVYGPRQRPDMAFHKFLRAALEGRPIVMFGDGGQTRDFTFVTDAVEATMAAGDRGTPGAVYNVGGGSRISLSDALTVIERVVGRPIEVRREPSQKGDMRDTYADTSRARADLGFAPSVTLEEGLAAEHAWLAASIVDQPS